MQHVIERQWYGNPGWLLLLAPLSAIFFLLSKVRRWMHTRNLRQLPVPVIVVGNISVGGTGKTPVIIALVKALQERGWRPAVISRGYGGDMAANHLVDVMDSPSQVGDEPLFIARTTQCPVAVGRDRVQSVMLLVQRTDCNLILSDDGLQHYRLPRDMEIAVVDGKRGLGNRWLLPVGPLRELPNRLLSVDWVLVNGRSDAPIPGRPKRVSNVSLQPTAWRNIQTGEVKSLDGLGLQGATAIAGIGNPQRFFDTLAELGFDGVTRSFADHHPFAKCDLESFQHTRLLMTEKDAIKCESWAGTDWWALQVTIILPGVLLETISDRLIAPPHDDA